MHVLRFLFLTLLVLLPMRAVALEVSPLAVRLDPVSGQSYATLTARNTLNQPVAIETYAEARSIDEMGNQTIRPEEQNFIVFPPQVRLAPGASQSFRVQWVGPVTPDMSDNYYAVVRRLPVPFNDAGGAAPSEARIQLSLGYAFKIAVGVVANNAQPALSIATTGPSGLATGGAALGVTISNSGRGYGVLTQFEFTVTKSTGETYTTNFRDWGDQAGISILPAGQRRIAKMPVPDPSWSSGVTVSLRKTR